MRQNIQSDDYSGATMTNPTVPAAYKSEIKEPVCLGRHSIVGAGGIVAPGVVLAEGTSIRTGGVVLRSTDLWAIYAGVPARRLKDRARDLLALEQAYLWDKN